MDKKGLLKYLDKKTRDNVARALWLQDFDVDKLLEEVVRNLISEKNSDQGF